MSEEFITRKIEFEEQELALRLFGPQASHLKILTEKSGVQISSRGNSLVLKTGAQYEQELETAANVLFQLYNHIKEGNSILPQDVDYSYRMLRQKPQIDLREIFQKASFPVHNRKTIAPRTLSQYNYLESIKSNDLVFGIGPAGTGKTYLAVAMAVAAYTRKEVKRIILTRPAVEAGEKLGFLPGDLVEKVNPYLRPLYDALYDMIDIKKVEDMLQDGVIEIAPLAFMRGRTLSDAFVILDEAQNTTSEQMKMFLTRIGHGSKAVVTGDVTQIDLPTSQVSGLVQAQYVLSGVKSVDFLFFHEEDVVRHPLVMRIVKAYDAFNNPGKKKKV
ncbi:MAG: PhoH family protein [Desulfovibrio sp.]